MLTNDRPITSRDEDRFGFAPTSDQIVSLCTGDMDTREGATIGLTGPWGSGKTSCLNIARERLKERGITVVELNPWLRANTGAIVIGLVSEVAKAIGKSKGRELKKLAKRYERTIKALASTAHPVFGALTIDLIRREESPEETKRKLVEELRSESRDEKPVVVVIDDIDRLEAEPLRELLRAVRLVADLPNVVYVMALDRNTTARMLERGGWVGNGHEYLDKIVEVELQVPPLQEEQRAEAIRELLAKLREAERQSGRKRVGLGDGAESGFDVMIMRLLETPRDIKRFQRSVEAVTPQVPEQVGWEDLIALQAIRTKLPNVGRIIEQRSADVADPVRLMWLDAGKGLTGSDDSAAKEAAKAILEAAEGHKIPLEKFLTYLPRVWEAVTGNKRRVIDRGGASGREKGHIANHAVLEAALGRRSGHELRTDLWAMEGFELLSGAGDPTDFLTNEERRSSLATIVRKLTGHVCDGPGDRTQEWIAVIQEWITVLMEIETITEDEKAYWQCTMGVKEAWKKTPVEARGTVAEAVLRATKSVEARARFLNMAEVFHRNGSVEWDEKELGRHRECLVEEARAKGILDTPPWDERRLADTARLLQTSLKGEWKPWSEPEGAEGLRRPNPNRTTRPIPPAAVGAGKQKGNERSDEGHLENGQRTGRGGEESHGGSRGRRPAILARDPQNDPVPSAESSAGSR